MEDDSHSVEAIADEIIPNPSSKKHGNAGKKVNEKQMESLRKGMAALKAKREAKAEAVKNGTYDPTAPEFAPKPKVVTVPRTKPEVVYVERKPTVRKSKPMAEQFEEIKSSISALSAARPPVEPKEVIKEVIKEVPVERVVEREVIRETKISGSALLDKIFFNR